MLVTGYELGSGQWGGFAEFVRVPAAWVVRLPAELTPDEAMTYGTAGFTAAQCVQRIVDHGVTPERRRDRGHRRHRRRRLPGRRAAGEA